MQEVFDAHSVRVLIRHACPKFSIRSCTALNTFAPGHQDLIPTQRSMERHCAQSLEASNSQLLKNIILMPKLSLQLVILDPKLEVFRLELAVLIGLHPSRTVKMFSFKEHMFIVPGDASWRSLSSNCCCDLIWAS